MTADDFTTAARAQGFYIYGASTGSAKGAFAVGAAWALDYLAAQESTDADYLIDVAMDAYAEASGQSVSRSWMVAALDAVTAARAARRDEEWRP